MKEVFTLTSDSLGGQATTDEIFGDAGGKNISPHLSWHHPPAGTKSFAITMFDPDAPTGSGWWHWLVTDIPANHTLLVAGAGDPTSGFAPEPAVQSLNDYGIYGYGGPCPPPGHGIHEYKITVFALGVETLGLTKDTNPAVVGFNIWANTLAKASIITYYER